MVGVGAKRDKTDRNGDFPDSSHDEKKLSLWPRRRRPFFAAAISFFLIAPNEKKFLSLAQGSSIAVPGATKGCQLNVQRRKRPSFSS